MKQSDKSLDEELLLHQLKEILLREDREALSKLQAILEEEAVSYTHLTLPTTPYV